MTRNSIVIIPSLNPDEKLKKTVDGMVKAGFGKIIIVNDGSDDEHLKYFPKADSTITVIHRKINHGKGAALKVAFDYVLKKFPNVFGVVTVDGDGQHTPEDTVSCIKALYENPESAVLGCRDFSAPDVPKKSRLGNKLTRTVFKTLCGIKITDTQTGLRAFPISMLPLLLSIKGERFDYETNMLLKLNGSGIDLKEVAIKTVYIEENASSHFRPFADSIKIYRFILAYFLSSILSFVADISFFYILCLVFGELLGGWCIPVATLVARAISSFLNYTLNRKHVFDSKESKHKSLIRYYLLAVPVMLISALAVMLLSKLFASTPIIQTLIKIVVDCVLFFLSYRIQRNWVFSEKNKESKKQQEEKEKKKVTVKNVVCRTLISISTAIGMIFITVVAACLMICYGPSETVRNMAVMMAMEASATKWIPGLFLSDDTVNSILEQSKKLDLEIVDTNDLNQNNDTQFNNETDEGTKLIFLNEPKFKAYVLLIKDPKRISVGVSADDFSTSKEGVGIFDIAEKYGCLAAINGGEFLDIGGMGNGARPMGITYSGGKLVWEDALRRTFIGFDKNDRLICKEGLTKAQAEKLGVRDGVCFKNGNTLIEPDGESVKIYKANASVGPAQRTAIGQTADGTVIMLVTDGRTADSIGATRNDVIDIMLSYGAVSAGMLDGGSSAMMYYENYAEKLHMDTSQFDDYQKNGMLNRYKAFTPPRSIPTYFIVK